MRATTERGLKASILRCVRVFRHVANVSEIAARSPHPEDGAGYIVGALDDLSSDLARLRATVMTAPRSNRGPRFTVATWREEATGPEGERRPHGDLWFARVVRVRPETAPFTDPRDEPLAVLEGRPRLPDAVRAAVARFLELHGKAARS
jgi:hypothetical protein